MPELKYLVEQRNEEGKDFCFTEQDESALSTEVSLRFILENNSWEDCKWAWRCVEGYDREFRLLAVAFAKPFKNLMADQRSLYALEVAEKFANGLSTVEELRVANDGAYDAYKTADAATDASDAATDASDAANFAYLASCSDRFAAHIINAAPGYYYADRAAKIQEFNRLLDCIEAGETYNI